MVKKCNYVNMKQALFIGQAPAFFGQATPLVGKAAKRLESLSGLTATQLDRNFDKINIFKYFPGRLGSGKGDKFDVKKARILARTINIDKYRLVIFLGLNVAKSFEKIKRPRLFKEFYLSKEDRLSIGLILPHPSGVSHFWNTVENRNKAARTLRRLIKKTGIVIGNYKFSKYFKSSPSRRRRNNIRVHNTNLHDSSNNHNVNKKSKYFF
jgi:uracil-DNA glycosylase